MPELANLFFHWFELIFRNRTLDAYVDDAPIVFWEVVSDIECKLLTVGNTFSDDYYGLVVSKDNLQNMFYEELNNLLHNYRNNFYLDRLREKWFTDQKTQVKHLKISSHFKMGKIPK